LSSPFALVALSALYLFSLALSIEREGEIRTRIYLSRFQLTESVEKYSDDETAGHTSRDNSALVGEIGVSCDVKSK